MINEVIMCGRLTKDIELRYTQNEKAVCNFNLAIQKNADEAIFPNCVAWNNTAEFISEHCAKGDKIVVYGFVNTRQWEDDDEETHYVTEIVVTKMDFAGQAQPSEKVNNKPKKGNQKNGNSQKKKVKPKTNNFDSSYAIDDDELPF
jgi:single-strand DNA-binding protein